MANQINIDIGAAANDGTGDPLRTAFNYVNLNFANVWDTGLPNSNVQFNNNRILTVNTNANLVLAPNGTGVVQSNVSILPNIDRVHNLGSASRKWDSIYANYLNIDSVDVDADLTVGGNLTVQGNIIQIGNIVTDSKTIQLANTASTANAADGSGITVGANDNIATLLYNSASNVWTTNIGISAVGNVTAPYFIGNGALLTGISVGSSYSNANVAAYLPVYSGNISAAYINVANNVNAINDVFAKRGTFTGDPVTGDASLYIGSPTFTNLGTDVMAQFTGNVPSYAQINLQNYGNSPTSSGDYIITADNGTDSTHFLDLGLAGSNWDGTQPNSLGNRVGANDGYLYVQDGDFVVGTSNGTIETWKFDQTGNLTIPGAIISLGSINIDNRASGNSADIQLFAADDITLQARDRSAGSGSEGGDINIYAGDSAEDGDSSGGDIQIFAGDGGAANVDFGGAGGFIRIESGRGGAAIGNTGATAESGGSLTLNAGDAGDNNGNIDLGADGGDVFIEAGFSTGNTNNGGDIVLTTGTGGQNGASGNVQINIPGYGLTPGGTWTFGPTGNLTLPSGNLVGTTPNNNGYLSWNGNSSGDGNGYTTLKLVPDDTRESGDQYLVIDPTAPGHIHIRAGGTQDNSSADLILGGENSFVKIAAGANSDVFVRSNSNDWRFGTDGVLTLPAGEGVLKSNDDTISLVSFNTTTGNANSVYLGSSGGLGFNDQEIGGNWLEIFRSGSEPEIRTTVGNINIQTADGNTAYNWTFDNTGNLTVPGNIVMPAGSSLVGNGASPAPNISGFNSINSLTVSASGNISGGNILGNGASMTGVATKTTGTWNVTAGTATYSFTVSPNGVYQLWVNGNIANGIIVYNATVSVSNTNVPVIGQQFAWNYEGAGNPIVFTSIPAQIIGTAGAISNANPSVGTTTNTFEFGINNSSGNTVTVNWGYTKIS